MAVLEINTVIRLPLLNKTESVFEVIMQNVVVMVNNLVKI